MQILPSITLLLVLLLHACSNQVVDSRSPIVEDQSDDSATRCLRGKTYIIGGEEIPESEYPSVLSISGCTGTYIAPNVFLTAAHCTSNMGKNKNPSPESISVNGKRPLKIIHHPQNPLVFRDLENNDLAILIMPDNSSSAYSPVLFREPKANDPIVVVGYGATSDNGGGGGKKRKGSNVLAGVENDGKLMIKRSGGAIGAAGDSGGPLFIDGKLAGTTVGGGGGTEFYTNLWSQENLDFLRQVVKNEGVKICGLDGFDCSQPAPSPTPAPAPAPAPAPQNPSPSPAPGNQTPTPTGGTSGSGGTNVPMPSSDDCN